MQTSKPFERSLKLRAAIDKVRATTASPLLQQQLISELVARKEFQSRGHGRGKRNGVNVKALNKMRRHDSKSLPRGGGKQEAARRVTRFKGDLTAVQVLSRRNGVFTKVTGVNTTRRMWHPVDDSGNFLYGKFSTRRAAVAYGYSAVLQ